MTAGRFAPSPSGRIHLGNILCCLLAWLSARQKGGKVVLRIEDLDTARCPARYAEQMMEDLRWLGAIPDGGIFYGSDYFEQCYEYAEKLIKEGKAYVDDQTSEEIAAQKGTPTQAGINSPYRSRSVEENLDLFERMNAGEFDEGARVLRAKIDMSSSNMHFRDPIMYRIIKYPPHRTRTT